MHSVEIGGVRIHVTHHDSRGMVRTELSSLLQKHGCDCGMRRLRACLIVVVWQMSVEEPDLCLTQKELSPCDGTRSIIVTWNGHPSTTQQGDFTGIEEHVVL